MYIVCLNGSIHFQILWFNLAYDSFNHVNFWSCISIVRPHSSVQSGGLRKRVRNTFDSPGYNIDPHFSAVSITSPFITLHSELNANVCHVAVE